ncbi:MAG: aspartate aminotransferase family protein [Rhodobacteraceae bacterium]|nr:aspartate aminotransferase family protein [Paracoccaceae bacterium]
MPVGGGYCYAEESTTVSRLQQLRFFPLAVTKGCGTRLTTDDGRTVLDLSASWGAASLGHGHPDWAGAVADAARQPAGASALSAAVAPAWQLARTLLDLTPGTDSRRVWIGHSGSDANETAARAVLAATGRPRIIAFSGAYHGGTAGSMAVSGHGSQAHAQKFPGLMLLPYPDPYRPFGGDPGGSRLLDHIAGLLAADGLGHEVAACFFEPILADGGMIVPPSGFMRGLAELCARYGILTVCDEVKIGLGRTGRLHGFEWEGITPDLVTFGKGLGGGLPVSALVGPAAILDHATAFSMQTLHGNPICASAALAVLDIIRRDDLAGNAGRVGARLRDGLATLAARHAAIGQIRGRGLAIGVELVRDGATRTPAPDLAAQVVYRAFELGAVLHYVGMQSNVLELTPPLILTEAEADEAVAILDQALSDVLAGRFDTKKTEPFTGW